MKLMGRIKQVKNFIVPLVEENEVEVVRNILTKEEYKIFQKMTDYDKRHSINVFLDVSKDDLLKEGKNYKKLALLHDCGKGEVGLFRRIKKVLVGDKKLENHPIDGYKKIEKIDRKLACLIKSHHDKDGDRLMKRFQSIDDRN